MPLYFQFLALLVVHFVADFMLQTHWQAQNKSKNNEALGRHVASYTAVLLVATPFIFPGMRTVGEPEPYVGWFLFVALNGALHFATDYFTSRWTSKLYAKGDWHNFFVVVGLDQLIHQFTLALTALWLFGPGRA